MKKFYFIFFIFLLGLMIIISGCSKSKIGNGEKVIVYKSDSCGCCELYANALEGSGFSVEVMNGDKAAEIKDKYNIPSYLQSCHTTIVGDYFVEGHVPFEAIRKLLDEKPDIKGIGLSGMPSGSPGMPGAKIEPFNIYSISNNGEQKEFLTV